MITQGSPVLTGKSKENELKGVPSHNSSSPKSSSSLSRIVDEILPNKENPNSPSAEQLSLEEKEVTQIDSSVVTKETFTSDYKIVILNNDVLRRIFALVSPEFTTRSRRVCRQFFHALDPNHKNMINYWMHHFTVKYANECNSAELVPPQNWYANYRRHSIDAKQRDNLGTAALVGGAVFLGGLLLGAFMSSSEPPQRERRGRENRDQGLGFGTCLALSAAAAGMAGAATYGALSSKPDREKKKVEVYREEQEQPVQPPVQVVDEQQEADRPLPHPLQPELRQRRMPNYTQSQRELQMQREVDRKMAEIAQEELEQQEKYRGCPEWAIL